VSGSPGDRTQFRRGVLTVRSLALRARRRLAAEAGFTLTELLMASVIGLLVVGTGAMVFTAAVRSQPGQSARSEAIRDGRTMTERLVRELRQGEALDASTGDSWGSQNLSFRTFVHNSAACVSTDPGRETALCRVTYTCTAGACTRAEADPQTGTPGTAVQVISGLASPAVFSYQTDPTAECPVPTPANEGVSISDAATLRNSGDSPGRVCVALVFDS
jgi:prepilin-type N-terminal cleavage/methylation domain-containing protein